MAEWPMVKLGEVCEVVSGGTPSSNNADFWDGNIPWVTPKDLSETHKLHIQNGSRYLTEEGLKRSSAAIVPTGTVLWSSRAPIGLVGIAANPLSTNQGFKSFIPSESLDGTYLASFLIFAKSQLQEMGTGATFKEVSKKRAQEIEIPLPPLDEQRRIAGILQSVETQQDQTKKLLGSIDSLQDSLVQKILDEHAAELTPLGSCIESIESGKSPRCEGHPAAAHEWGVLKLSAVTTGHFLASENKALNNLTQDIERREIHPGDILMTRKNTPELVGAVCLIESVRPQLAFPDLMFRINLNQDKLVPRFFQALMMSPEHRQKVRELAGGSAKSMSNISQSRLRDLEIPLPSISAQREFEEAAQQVSLMRSKILQKLEILKEIRRSLATRAFAGEL